jgi:gamma-glutamyl-gamma-aminobutyrate hydrolase PuuD
VGDLVSRVSGLMLSGGPDLHPSAYGAAVDRNLGPTEPELDHFELALLREAFDAIPLPVWRRGRGLPDQFLCLAGQLLRTIDTVRLWRSQFDGRYHVSAERSVS